MFYTVSGALSCHPVTDPTRRSKTGEEELGAEEILSGLADLAIPVLERGVKCVGDLLAVKWCQSQNSAPTDGRSVLHRGEYGGETIG